MSNKVLVIAGHHQGTLDPGTLRSVTAARQIPDATIDILLPGSGSESDLVEQLAAIDGVTSVLWLQHPDNSDLLAAKLAPQVLELAGEYSHIMASSGTFGKDLMPRIAALMNAPQVSDLMEVLDARTFKRPVYAGNAIAEVTVPDSCPVLATIRSASFSSAPTGNDQAETKVLQPKCELPDHTTFHKLETGESDRPDLQSASRVVSGGRGLGNRENFDLVYQLADRLGAAVGASRAAVDAAFVGNDLQVGQTGKIIAPELYIALGISGAIQHLTGIKDAGTIVAINKDPDAPIFEIADYGLVADVFTAVPELMEKLDKQG